MINTLLIMMKISKKEILDMCLLRLTLPQSPHISTQVAQFVRQPVVSANFIMQCVDYNLAMFLNVTTPPQSSYSISTQVAQFVFHLFQNIALMHCVKQGCISCGILVSGIRARGVSSEHMENMEMFSCSPT